MELARLFLKLVLKDFLYLSLFFFFFAKAFVKAAQVLSGKEMCIIFSLEGTP